ncbi:anthranilate synthase component II [Oceanobacillus jeddahense]|uniref:Aminodeoxychorismate/anthranilate synthase component II n=1 Tax=Oceanobacillus jeddahense TaxID=1462527 RepID=A0ABY5JXU7_9BACI|nr:aminodeoxychorismate/anthranilate synthase component II [Oceanobacillus jeddahense]UUI04272.1 aminodeoxychorismate/anthranilate synthase component II [Oceanobacillus jeddahense]
MLLMIDNYDSFTYNIVHYLENLDEEVIVKYNDKLTIEEIEQWQPDYIVLSPGPHTPEKAGITLKVIEHFKESIPILGICLGHQAIGQVFGAEVIKNAPVHGKQSSILNDQQGVFSQLPKSFIVTRYHSLSIHPDTLPENLTVSATAEDGTIMGIRHKTYPIEGIQFHPESVSTEHGYALLNNFLMLYKKAGELQK